VRFGLGPIGVSVKSGAARSREFENASGTGTSSKFVWIIEGRVGAYLDF